MSFRRLIAYNALIQIIGKALGVAFSLATVILLTRYLGPAGFGQYSTVLAFVGFFVILADLGVYGITVREMAQNRTKKTKILSNIFSYRLFSSLFVFVFAFLISFLLPYEPIVKLAIGIVALQSFFAILTTFWGTIFQVNYRMDLPTFIEVFSRALYFTLTFLAIQLKFDLLGVFWFFVITAFINLFLIYLVSLKFIKLKLQLDWQFLKYFFKESWPLGLVTVLGMINFKIGPILLSLSKPMTDVGIYGSAYRIFENLVIIPVIFVDLIFPKLSELFLKNHHQFKNFFQKTFDVLLIMVFPIVIFFLILAPYWIYIIAGKEFITASYPLKILIVTLFFTFLSYPLIQLLVAGGKQKWLLWATGFFVGPTIILNLILAPSYSYNGTAWVTLITTFINFLFLLGLTRYLLKIRPNFSLIGKLVLPSSIMIFFLYFILSTPFFSLEIFAQFSLLKQIILVISVFLSASGIYSLMLFGLNIISFSFLGKLASREKSNHHD